MNKTIKWVTENQLLLGLTALAIAVVIATYIFTINRGQPTHAELFALNEECSLKAKAWAERQTGTDRLGHAEVSVFHTSYSKSRKSCFAEMSSVVKITDPQSSYKDFSVLRIQDVSKEKTLVSWIHQGSEQWGQTNTLEEYEQLKRELFGVGLYE